MAEMGLHVQYAGPNPVAFDIANHWCEYGADYHTDTPHLLDYSLMPDEQQQASPGVPISVSVSVRKVIRSVIGSTRGCKTGSSEACPDFPRKRLPCCAIGI